MTTRRAFLATGTAALAGLAARPVAASTAALVARPGEVQIAPADYAPTRIWGFDGQVPGTELRLRQGGRLARRVINGLDQPTSVHWHGIRIANAMDGVPEVTQAAIAPGGEFDYDFVCPDAGTYWYHSHNRAVEQVARGLYGALIVEEAEPPEVDGEHVLTLDDWRLGPDAQIVEDFGNGHDLSHAGRLGNVVTTNARVDWSAEVRQGDRLRLRLINVSNARIFVLSLEGLAGWIVALDGMPLGQPRAVEGRFVLGPAQRVDLIADVTAESGGRAFLVDHVGDDAYEQAVFLVKGGGAPRGTAPAALPPNPSHGMPAADAPVIEVRMQGGAMRWLENAAHMGVMKDGRTLAGEGIFWALSGVAGRPEAPLAEVPRGASLRFDFVNDTVFPHAMHLHGHHIYEIGPDGALGDFRDTTLVDAGARVSVAFVAHNPGDWLLHCHMLAHHAAGMGTWIRVT